MPRQFQDFSQEVSQGTGKIKSGLDAVRNAADEADSSSGNLSRTQDVGTRVADGYSKSMAGVSREMSGLATAAQTAVREISGADSVVKSFGSSMSTLKGASAELYEIRDVTRDISEMDIDRTRSNFSSLAVESGMAAKNLRPVRNDLATISKLKWGELRELREAFGFEEMSKGIKSLQNELTKLDGSTEPLTEIQKASFLEFSVRLAGAKELDSFLDDLPESEKNVVGLTVASKGLDAAIGELAQRNELFAAKLRIAANEAEEAATASKTYAGEVKKAGGVLGAFNEKLDQGKQEAEGFAGGVGVSGGKAIAAGVAIFFLAKKVAELIDEFKDSALELSRFNVELELLEGRAKGLGFTGTFGSLRDELNLTRAQSKDFFEVLREGALSGVVSTNQLTQAALQLRDAFGGEQTDRLREYVNLLKEIPTLDADLSISASLDDQAAAVFALARSGNIETVIDLQAAGLLGGIQTEVLSEQDVELLNAAQKTEKSIEDVSDFLTGKMFPTWGPQFSAIASGTGKIVAGIGGAIAAIGFLSALTGTQIASQNATTAAVLATGGLNAASGIGKQIAASATPGLVKGLTSVILGGGGGAMGAAVGGVAAAAAPAAIAVAIAAAVAALGVGMAYAGSKLGDFGDDLISEGKKVSGGLAKIYGASLQATAALTLLGPVVGSLVAVAVAGEDLGAGLEAFGEGLQEQVGGINKYNSAVRGAGGLISDLGTATMETVQGLKIGAKEIVKDLPRIADELADSLDLFIPGFKAVTTALKEAPKLIYSQDYLDAVKGLQGETTAYNRNLKSLARTSEQFDASLVKEQKRVQISALALQKQLQATAAAVESGKVQFLDFANEVRNLRLDNLAEIGGTAGEFNNAIAQASKGVTNRFKEVSDALVKRRSDIIKDSKLSAVDRRNALLDLKKQELEATRKFVEGVNQVVDSLFQTPEIVKAQLERGFQQQKFDLRVEEGVGGFDNLLNQVNKQFVSFQTEADATFEALAQSSVELKKQQEAIAEVQEDNFERIKKNFKELPDEAKNLVQGLDFDNFDVAEGQKALDKFREESSKVIDEIDRLSKSLPSASFVRLSGDLAKFRAESKKLKKAVKKAEEETFYAGGPKELSEAQEVEANLKKKALDARNKISEIEGKLYQAYGKQFQEQASEKEIKSAIADIAEDIASGEAVSASELLEQKELVGLKRSLAQSIADSEDGANKETLRQLAAKKKQANAQIQFTGSLESLVEGTNAELAVAKKRNEVLENARKLVGDAEILSENITKATEAGVKAQQRELDVIKSQESLALLTNRSSEQLFKLRDKQNEIAGMTLSQTAAAINTAQRIKKDFEKRAKIEMDDDVRAILEASIKKQENTIVSLNKKRGEAVESLGRVGDAINAGFERFNDSLPGRAIQQQFDLSDVTADFARFSDDFEGAVERSTRIAIATANKRAAMERRILEESLAQEERDLMARAAGAGANAPQVLAEGKALIAAKKRTELARIELTQKQKVVDAAQREASLKLEALDIEQGVIDAEMDFYSEIGGSFSTIYKLQQRGVMLEQEKLRILEAEYEAAKASGVEGLELDKKAAAVRIQSLKAEKASFGAQKDIFEKLLGKAFGEMRTEIGAARRRGSDVGLLGRDRTRVVGRSGLFLKSKPGDVKTIEQRARDNAVNRIKSNLDSVGMAVAAAAPERLSIEQEIAKTGQTTAQQSKRTADNTARLVQLFSEATPAGGVGVEAAVRDLDRNQDGVISALERGELTRRDNLAAGFGSFADATSSLEERPGTTPAMMADLRKGAEMSEMMPSEIRVQGQINIMMNTQLFRAEMANLVAEAISSPEVRKAMENVGVVNTNS